MTLRTYIILAVVAFLFVACWISTGLYHAVFLTFVSLPAFLLVYLIGRLFLAVVRRLER